MAATATLSRPGFSCLLTVYPHLQFVVLKPRICVLWEAILK